MAVLLGIDYGDSRIGISVCDENCTVATPKTIVDGKNSLKVVVAEIGKIATECKATGIVVGYPINMDGSYGDRIRRTDKFIERFSAEFPNITVAKQDERLTTKSADRAMLTMGVSQRAKGVSDMIAAQIILQTYIDKMAK